MYGIDLLSTGDLLKYFADYGGLGWSGMYWKRVYWRRVECRQVCTPAVATPTSHPPIPFTLHPRHPHAGPKFVEWINDSSANVVFADGPTAKRAVAGLGQALPPDEAPEQLGERLDRVGATDCDARTCDVAAAACW